MDENTTAFLTELGTLMEKYDATIFASCPAQDNDPEIFISVRKPDGLGDSDTKINSFNHYTIRNILKENGCDIDHGK